MVDWWIRFPSLIINLRFYSDNFFLFTLYNCSVNIGNKYVAIIVRFRYTDVVEYCNGTIANLINLPINLKMLIGYCLLRNKNIYRASISVPQCLSHEI